MKGPDPLTVLRLHTQPQLAQRGDKPLVAAWWVTAQHSIERVGAVWAEHHVPIGRSLEQHVKRFRERS